MATKQSQFDPRVDAYIAEAPPYSQPILKYLRAVVHAACPQVAETMKWSRPHFDYKGVICGMSAFKAHCTLGFWKGELIVPKAENKNAMAAGQFGRIESLKDLPSKKQIIAYVHAAMKLNEDDVKAPKMANRKTRAALPVPADLAAALKKHNAANTTFKDFSPSNRREYISWINDAKTDETRQRRLNTAIEWMTEGKVRDWKYAKK